MLGSCRDGDVCAGKKKRIVQRGTDLTYTASGSVDVFPSACNARSKQPAIHFGAYSENAVIGKLNSGCELNTMQQPCSLLNVPRTILITGFKRGMEFGYLCK